MELYDRARLEAHYDKIFQDNRQALLAGGVGDPYLRGEVPDRRMALALVLRVGDEVAERVCALLEGLGQAVPGLYRYPRSDLHVTVLDVLRGEPDRQLPPDLDRYVRCIARCAGEIPPFFLRFQGTTASDGALLIRGCYEAGLEELRQGLRLAFAREGLALEERYQTFSAHITAARLIRPLEQPQAFLPFAQRDTWFGDMRADRLELTFHDWYDAKKQALAEFSLGGQPV